MKSQKMNDKGVKYGYELITITSFLLMEFIEYML